MIPAEIPYDRSGSGAKSQPSEQSSELMSMFSSRPRHRSGVGDRSPQRQGGSGSAEKVDFEMDSSRCNYRLVGAALASIEAYETCLRQLV